MKKTTGSYSLQAKVEEAFRNHCKKNRFMMSGIVEDLMLDWLLRSNALSTKEHDELMKERS